MLNYRKISLLLVFIISVLVVNAQYTLNSPYSRYGFGDLVNSGISSNRGMGGTGIGLRERNNINILNPASYNTQDTFSFIWDFGAMATLKDAKTSNASMKMKTMNFDHMVFSFPLTRKYFMAIGVSPYSKVGYTIQDVSKLQDSTTSTTILTGSGNLNQFFIGNSFGFFEKKLNFGVNIQYIFGALSYNDILSNENLSENKLDSKLAGWTANFGVQAVLDIRPDLNLVLGATYQLKTQLSGDEYFTVNNKVIINQIDTMKGKYQVPGRLGVGASMYLKDKLILSLDYTIQDWSKVDVPRADKENGLKTYNKINMGVQYTPEKESYMSYFNRISYRGGMYLEKSFVDIKGNNINDYGFSLGCGLPFKRTGTVFNLALEYGIKGTTNANLVQENYWRFSMNISLFDNWFIKRKYN